MIDRLKSKLLAYLFRTINPNDIIHTEINKETKKTDIFIGGKLATLEELQTLQEEVKYLEHTRIWKLMTETPRAQAMEIGFKKSVTFDDVKTCKLMMLIVDIQESTLNVIKNKKIM